VAANLGQTMQDRRERRRENLKKKKRGWFYFEKHAVAPWRWSPSKNG